MAYEVGQDVAVVGFSVFRGDPGGDLVHGICSVFVFGGMGKRDVV